MARSPVFGFHPKCAPLRITHLAYADDVLLMCRGDAVSVQFIMNCLNKFGDTAGLRINLLKSDIYLASIAPNVQEEILAITGFSLGSFPIPYLGIPVAARKSRCADYSLLIDALDMKIKAWPRHSLSFAGKIELIRSVLQGVECFWLSILPLPSTVIDVIHSMCRKFVWHSKWTPIAWATLCKPVDDDGMGLKNLRAWNKALLAKTMWKIHLKKDSLWIRWVNHIYGRFGSVWNWDWNRDASPLIKQLIIIRDELVSGLGSVDTAAVRLDVWFGSIGGLSRAYDFFVQRRGRWPWKPLITTCCIVPKHRFTLWMWAHGKLLTRDRLLFVEGKSCALCGGETESIQHLFFECTTARRIWDGIRDWLDMKKQMGSKTSVLKAFRSVDHGNSTISKMRKVALAATVYQIWNIRNQVIFEAGTPNVEEIIKNIKIQIFCCLSNTIEVL